jgi:hypothetical protein
MKIYDRPGHAIAREILSDVTHQRLSEDRERRLSTVGCQRPKSFTVTRSQNHCLHARSILSGLEHKRPRLHLFVTADCKRDLAL